MVNIYVTVHIYLTGGNETQGSSNVTQATEILQQTSAMLSNLSMGRQNQSTLNVCTMYIYVLANN